MILAILLVHHNTHPIDDGDDESQSIIGPTQNESDSDNDSQLIIGPIQYENDSNDVRTVIGNDNRYGYWGPYKPKLKKHFN